MQSHKYAGVGLPLFDTMCRGVYRGSTPLSQMHQSRPTSIRTCLFPERRSPEWIVKKDCFLQLEPTCEGCIPDRPLSRGFGINAFGKLTWLELMHSGNMHLGNRRSSVYIDSQIMVKTNHTLKLESKCGQISKIILNIFH